jgi:hypothetical protein
MSLRLCVCAVALVGALWPRESGAQSEYVYPIGLWVHRPAVTNYVPKPGMPTLWSYIDKVFADARDAYTRDWDGTGSLDVACDVEIVREWVDTFVEGQPSPYPVEDCYQPGSAIARFGGPLARTLPLQASAFADAGCRWDNFLWETPGPAFFVYGSDQWAVHTGGVGSGNGHTLVGWRVAHETLHVVGGRHLDPGCDMMKYVNCDCTQPACGSTCDSIWRECAKTMTPAQIEDSLTRAHCDMLRSDSHTMPRCTWEQQSYDCDGNGIVDVRDLLCLVGAVNRIAYGSKPFDKRYDCNYDHAVNVSDQLCWNGRVTSHLFRCPR